MGDSHAMNLFAGLDELFNKDGVRLTAFYHHGCPFLYGTFLFAKTGQVDTRCEGSVNKAYDHLSNTMGPVILVGEFSNYAGRLGGALDRSMESQSREEIYRGFEKHLHNSMKKMRTRDPHRKIILFKSAFSTSVDINNCRAAKGDDSELCKPGTLEESRAMNLEIDTVLERAGTEFDNVYIIDQAAAFCVSKPCVVSHNKELLFRDTAHLTVAGSKYLARAIKKQLHEVLAVP